MKTLLYVLKIGLGIGLMYCIVAGVVYCIHLTDVDAEQARQDRIEWGRYKADPFAMEVGE